LKNIIRESIEAVFDMDLFEKQQEQEQKDRGVIYNIREKAMTAIVNEITDFG